MNTIVLNLLEATLTLYPVDELGQPLTSAPIWTGAAVERLVVREQWLKVGTRASGAAYPRQHPQVPTYEVSLGRVWILQTADRAGYIAGESKFVLDVVWVEEETRDWHRETFYNVTVSERSRTSRSIDEGFTDDQVFDAEYLVADGGTGTPPALSASLPYRVKYLSGPLNGQPGESVWLYRYDQGTKNFTEHTAGVATGRATLGYVPNQTGTFEITFAGDASPAFRLRTDGVAEVLTLNEKFPPRLDELPRVEFFYGNQRVGAVSQAGNVFGGSFRAETATAGQARFLLVSNSTVQGSIEGERLVAADFSAFAPTSVTGLKLWVRARSLTGLGDGDFAYVSFGGGWPDLSGNGNNLLAGVASGRFVTRPTQDVSITTAFPDDPRVSGAAVSFIKRHGGGLLTPHVEYAKTAAAIVNTDTMMVFMVVMPFQKDISFGEALENDLMSSGNAQTGQAGGEFVLGLTSERKLFATYWTAAGATANTATAAAAVWPDFRPAWILAEMEVGATTLTVRLNGVQQAVVTLVGAKAGATLPVLIGERQDGSYPAFSPALLNAMSGYVREAIVYQGVLSAADKERVRKHLNREYRIY